jgi:hypothetical protein
MSPCGQALISGAFALLGVLIGAWVSWIAWNRQFWKQHKLSVIQETAKALGMFYEDATNPEASEKKERQLATGQTVRDVMLRVETSSALATQALMVKAVFGERFEKCLRKLTGSFSTTTDPTGNKFVEAASSFLKTLITEV